MTVDCLFTYILVCQFSQTSVCLDCQKLGISLFLRSSVKKQSKQHLNCSLDVAGRGRGMQLKDQNHIAWGEQQRTVFSFSKQKPSKGTHSRPCLSQLPEPYIFVSKIHDSQRENQFKNLILHKHTLSGVQQGALKMHGSMDTEKAPSRHPKASFLGQLPWSPGFEISTDLAT